jgi:hypothetical protein
MASLAIVASTGDSVRSLFQPANRPSGVSSGTNVACEAQLLIVAISSVRGFRNWRTVFPCWHYVPEEQPERLVDELREFFRTAR